MVTAHTPKCIVNAGIEVQLAGVFIVFQCSDRGCHGCGRIGKFKRILALEEADQEGFQDEGLFYHQRKRGDPRSRAQQQLTELEGKERLEKSRVERRLTLTQSVRQGMSCDCSGCGICMFPDMACRPTRQCMTGSLALHMLSECGYLLCLQGGKKRDFSGA